MIYANLTTIAMVLGVVICVLGIIYAAIYRLDKAVGDR